MRLARLPMLALLMGLAITACSTSPAGQAAVPGTASVAEPSRPAAAVVEATPSPRSPAATATAQATQTVGATSSATQDSGPAQAQRLTRTDEQGAVTVEVTPLNLDSPGVTLDFDVTLNTHSVDLGIDLAGLAQMTTDNGRSALAARWDAPSGGHHVQGTLSFPVNVDGQPLLTGARTLTLTLRNVDVPERTFVWELAGQS